LSQKKGLKVLQNRSKVLDQINQLKNERAVLKETLSKITSLKKIYPSEANFLLVEFEDSNKIFTSLISKGVIIRNRTSEVKNCLRITVGTPDQNKVLIKTIKEI
jgi:histidinol-phosphate aminotransferase